MTINLSLKLYATQKQFPLSVFVFIEIRNLNNLIKIAFPLIQMGKTDSFKPNSYVRTGLSLFICSLYELNGSQIIKTYLTCT